LPPVLFTVVPTGQQGLAVVGVEVLPVFHHPEIFGRLADLGDGGNRRAWEDVTDNPGITPQIFSQQHHQTFLGIMSPDIPRIEIIPLMKKETQQ
jgi:hypothetical protein